MWHLFGHHIQQCCTRACAAAIGIRGDGLFVASVSRVATSSSSFRIVKEPSLEYLSDESLSMQSLFEQIAFLVFKALRGMTPMYLQDLLQVKIPGSYSLRSDVLGLHKVLHTCIVQDLWRPRICCCSSQILEQPSSGYQRE